MRIFITAGLLALGLNLPASQQGNETIYKIGGEVSAPRLLNKIDPQYTEDARKAKIEGNVELSLIVGSDGVARSIQVVKSLEPELDVNAVAAVQQWKFQPAVKDGQAVSVYATIMVNFRFLAKK